MIIFNGRGAIIGILSIIILIVLSSLLKLSYNFSFFLTGIIALYLSFKVSSKGEGYSGMPTIFFIPTHIYAILIIFVGFKEFKRTKTIFKKNEPVDIRTTKLENDIDSLDNIGIYGDRVIANQVKSILDSVLINQLKPQNISCLVKVNDDNNAVLLLLKVDKIDLLSKEAKKEFVSILESILYETNNLSTRMQYIGICNKNNSLEITQSPYRNIQTSYLLAYSSDLLDFYGTLNEE